MKTADVLNGLVIAVLSGTANAQIYKCVDAGGKTSFSQTPCTSGANATLLENRRSAPLPHQSASTPTASSESNEKAAATSAPAETQTASASSRCRPLPPVELVARRADLKTAMSSRFNSPERDEALRLEMRFLQEEEQYDMLPANVAAQRTGENARITSIDFRTRDSALRSLRKIHQLGWDWDGVSDAATGKSKLLCRSITTGLYGPDSNCECKPRVSSRWR